MSRDCCLCKGRPAIQNSHVVPNFIVKRLKKGTPVPFLVQSTNVTLSIQDSWKGEYLCGACEQEVSRWENWFCREVYDPFEKEWQASFAYDENLALFLSSLHFRWFCHLQGSCSEVPEPYCVIAQKARDQCRGITATGPHLYLSLLFPIRDDHGFLPGINTYFYEAIDGHGYRVGSESHAILRWCYFCKSKPRKPSRGLSPFDLSCRWSRLAECGQEEEGTQDRLGMVDRAEPRPWRRINRRLSHIQIAQRR